MTYVPSFVRRPRRLALVIRWSLVALALSAFIGLCVVLSWELDGMLRP